MSSICLFKNYLLISTIVLGSIVLDTEDTSMNQIHKNPHPHEVYILVRERGSKCMCVRVHVCTCQMMKTSMKSKTGEGVAK